MVYEEAKELGDEREGVAPWWLEGGVGGSCKACPRVWRPMVGISHKEWAWVPLAEKTAREGRSVVIKQCPEEPGVHRGGSTLLAGGGGRKGGNEGTAKQIGLGPHPHPSWDGVSALCSVLSVGTL